MNALILLFGRSLDSGNSRAMLWFLALLAMLIGEPAGFSQGTLQDFGRTTYDPRTGLEWLDLSLTAGQSYEAVAGGWNGYTTTEGFRFATRDEVVSLFFHAGGTRIGTPDGPVRPENLAAVQALFSLMGMTLSGNSLDRSWMLYDPSTETHPYQVPNVVFGSGIMRTPYQEEEGFYMAPGIFVTPGYHSAEIGSALVRAVPEPATLAILVFGLLLLCGRKCKARS